MPILNTRVDTLGIATILSSSRHIVPIYQRSFVWTKEDEQVQEFLTDIHMAFKKQEEYFLGSIVVIPGDNDQPLTIVDGQQRLTVTTLLLNQIINKFIDLNEQNNYTHYHEKFIATYVPRERRFMPRLILNQVDDPFFQAIIEGTCTEPERGDYESHFRLWNANDEISQWVTSITESSNNPIELLVDLITFLEEKAYVIYFKVPDDANAFLIFETLNDRGLDLSTADLVKNCVLGRAGKDNINSTLELWNAAVNTLRAYGGEDLFKIFLRQYWISDHGLVREKQLYSTIKSSIATQAHVRTFISDLSRSSNRYAAIMSPDHDFWSASPLGTRNNIDTLASLFGSARIIQYRPALLATIKHFDPNEAQKVIKLIVNWTIRLIVTTGIAGGTLENRYAELAHKISIGELRNAREVSGYANENFVPNNVSFRKAFQQYRVPNAKIARYLLHTLELQNRGEQQEEIPNPDSNELNLEHILPQRPEEGKWQNFEEEDKRYYSQRLGNLALLLGEYNRRIGNCEFTRKKEMYAQSKITLTYNIAEMVDWTPEALEQRQTEMASLALRAWRIRV